MQHGSWLVSLAVLLGLASSSQAQAPRPNLPGGMEVHLDLENLQGGHDRPRLDLYLPEKAA